MFFSDHGAWTHATCGPPPQLQGCRRRFRRRVSTQRRLYAIPSSGRLIPPLVERFFSYVSSSFASLMCPPSLGINCLRGCLLESSRVQHLRLSLHPDLAPREIHLHERFFGEETAPGVADSIWAHPGQSLPLLVWHVFIRERFSDKLSWRDVMPLQRRAKPVSP